MTATRFAPSRAVSRFFSRSQVSRGRRSAKSSEGYRPESMSSTPSKTVRLRSANGAARADGVEQRVDVPVVHRDHRDDLLREHIERIARIADSTRSAPRAWPA